MRRQALSHIRSFLFVLLAFASSLALATPGDVIQKVLTPIPGGFSMGVRPVLQSDGKILIAGRADYGTMQFSVTRLNADGSVDTSYGTGEHPGTTHVAFGPEYHQVTDAALQADGKLVVVGRVRQNDKNLFAMARFNPDGSVDPALTRVFSFGGFDSGAGSVAIQPDGRILIGGYNFTGPIRSVFIVVRWNADGTFDDTYGTSGAYQGETDPLRSEDIRSMALQADGKLVVAGDSGNRLKVLRLNANGTLDTSYGTGGSTVLTNMIGAWSTAIQPDGKALVSGSARRDAGNLAFAVARFTTGGQLDTPFGTNGIALSATATGYGQGVALQPDGKIVVSGGSEGISTSYAHWMFRWNANGTSDASFGTNGEANATISPYSLSVGGVLVRPDGTLITTGGMLNAAVTDTDTTVVSFTASGGLDASFNGSGVVTLDLGSDAAFATGSALQADGKLVVSGTFTAGEFGAGSLLTRYLASGAIDASFGTNGFTFFGTHTTEAVAIQRDGKIVTGGMSRAGPDPSMTFSRFNADGTFDAAFGSGGSVTFPTAAAREWVKALAIQPDGKIVGAGLLKHDALTDGRVVRLNADGSLDTSFGSGGFVTVDMSAASDELYGIALQPEGKIVVAGRAEVSASQSNMTAARLNTNGTLDTSFGSGGLVTVDFSGDSWAYAVALQADGKIVLGGYAKPGANNDFALSRLLPNGALDGSFGTGGRVTRDFGLVQNGLRAIRILSSGKIVGAGWDMGGTFGVVQFLANGALDTSFGSGGHRTILMNAGADVARTLAVGSDGTLYVAGDASNMIGVARVAGEAPSGPPPRATASMSLGSSSNPSTAGQAVTFTTSVSGSSGTPTGTVTFRDNGASIGGCSGVALASGSAQCTTSALSSGSHPITVAYSGDGAYEAGTSGAFTQTVNAAPSPGALAFDPTSIDFGTESMGTTSPPRTITVTNTGGSTVTISAVTVTSQFGQSNDCGSLAPGATCSIAVTFSPAPAEGGLNSSGAVSGTLTVSSNAGNPSAALQGRGEKSLVTHYYRGILRRDPDASGHAFWQGEAQRLASLGANVNETWFAMAMEFLRSAEYASLGRDDAGYVTDMYNTFFNRAPDASGFDYWMGQMRSGMPRETVLAQFLFSGEFASFTRAIFGDTSARPEVDLTMDFYRGALSRLPDSGGFNFYLGRLRSAQCNGAGAVASLADTISAEFFNGAEYAGRNRSNAQYMADIYNALMRRGSDLEGMNFWIGKLDRGEATRDQVRQQFLQSPEFSHRVDNIVNAGCAQ